MKDIGGDAGALRRMFIRVEKRTAQGGCDGPFLEGGTLRDKRNRAAARP